MSGAVIATVIVILVVIAALLCIYFYCIGPCSTYLPCMSEASPISPPPAVAREEATPLNNAQPPPAPKTNPHPNGAPDALPAPPSYEQSQKEHNKMMVERLTFDNDLSVASSSMLRGHSSVDARFAAPTAVTVPRNLTPYVVSRWAPPPSVTPETLPEFVFEPNGARGFGVVGPPMVGGVIDPRILSSRGVNPGVEQVPSTSIQVNSTLAPISQEAPPPPYLSAVPAIPSAPSSCYSEV